MGNKVDCLDCIREGITPPNERYKGTSYCLLHNSHRSMKSTATAKIRKIVEAENWDALSQTDKYGAPVFSYDVLKPFIERYRKVGESAARQAQSIPENERFDGNDALPAYAAPFDEAEKAFSTMLALQLKRTPTRAERAIVYRWINPPSEDELAYEEELHAVDLHSKQGPQGNASSNTQMPGRPGR